MTDARAIFDTYAGQAAPTRFMNFVRHDSVAESEAFAMRCLDCWQAGSVFPWAIETISGDFIGVIELRLSPPKADFGYSIGEAYWGQGFGTEVARAVVEWAMAQPSIFRVWATCHPDNAASAAVLRKAGLNYEATLANWEARPQLREPAGPSHCYAWTRSTK